jgi:hypothetical protein
MLAGAGTGKTRALFPVEPFEIGRILLVFGGGPTLRGRYSALGDAEFSVGIGSHELYVPKGERFWNIKKYRALKELQYWPESRDWAGDKKGR